MTKTGIVVSVDLVLSLVAGSTRLLSNHLVSRKRRVGWLWKVPSMCIFTYFNVKFGLWGLHLLTAAEAYIVVRARREWLEPTSEGTVRA